jgi:ATP-binding cassette subfamily F protein 3
VNGAGKSTLIKTIAGELAPLTGESTTGKGLNIGYFAQHQVEMLRHDESPLWHLAKIAPTTREQELRNFLGGFNFPGTMVTSSIAPFSGGEKARLALALIVWQRPNLLLLDEPTNHLDLETREALTEALAQFEGTLVVVSHDRHLLRATTDQFIIVADGKLQPFDGDLDDYKDWLFQTKLGKGTDVLPAAGKDNKTASRCSRQWRRQKPKLPRRPATPRNKSARRRKTASACPRSASRSSRRSSAGRADRQAHGKKAEVDAQLGEESIYDAANKAKLKQLLADQTSSPRTWANWKGVAGLQEQLEALA